MELFQNAYFSLFVIVALGYMLGSIKIKGVSLDVSAVIFIALLFGHFGILIPKDLQDFGMIIFIFTIGIQAGPGFFDSFRSKGSQLARSEERRGGKEWTIWCRSGWGAHK